MELNQECLGKAVKAFMECLGSPEDCIAAGIAAYNAEMLTPGESIVGEAIVGEAIPPRDYRKELWIAHWAAIDGKTKFEDAVCGT